MDLVPYLRLQQNPYALHLSFTVPIIFVFNVFHAYEHYMDTKYRKMKGDYFTQSVFLFPFFFPHLENIK